MTIDVATQATFAPGMAHMALEFINDPRAAALAYMEASTPANQRHSGDEYPYALGQAIGIIHGLLDVAGFPELGPDRFDCEWSLTHPYIDEDYA